MNTQKHIQRALEDISFAIEWETKDKQDEEIKFWLEHMYMQGQIDLYKQNVK